MIRRWSWLLATWPDYRRDSAALNCWPGYRRPRNRRSRAPLPTSLRVPRTRPWRISDCYETADSGSPADCRRPRRCYSRPGSASATSGAVPLCCCAYPRTPWTPRWCVLSTCSSANLANFYPIILNCAYFASIAVAFFRSKKGDDANLRLRSCWRIAVWRLRQAYWSPASSSDSFLDF